jgi:hypothetical protein
MLTNLLICTDASDASDRMVECVKDLRRVGSRKALLTHVLNIRDARALRAGGAVALPQVFDPATTHSPRPSYESLHTMGQ